MDKDAIVNQVETDGRRLIEVARADLDAAVPTCGDWKLRDLAGHMGWVHSLVGSYVASRATEPLGREQMPQVPQDDSAVDFAAAALDGLVDALAGIEPDHAGVELVAPARRRLLLPPDAARDQRPPLGRRERGR